MYWKASDKDKNIDSDVEEKDDIVYLYLVMMRRSNPTLFLNALNTSVVAAWRIHTKYTDNNLSHLDFQSEVSLGLLKSVPSRTSFKRPRMSSFPDDVRFDGFDHYKAKTTTGRCKVCKKNTNYQCTKCLVRLHYDRATTCSVTYHTKPE